MAEDDTPEPAAEDPIAERATRAFARLGWPAGPRAAPAPPPELSSSAVRWLEVQVAGLSAPDRARFFGGLEPGLRRALVFQFAGELSLGVLAALLAGLPPGPGATPAASLQLVWDLSSSASRAALEGEEGWRESLLGILPWMLEAGGPGAVFGAHIRELLGGYAPDAAQAARLLEFAGLALGELGARGGLGPVAWLEAEARSLGAWAAAEQDWEDAGRLGNAEGGGQARFLRDLGEVFRQAQALARWAEGGLRRHWVATVVRGGFWRAGSGPGPRR